MGTTDDGPMAAGAGELPIEELALRITSAAVRLAAATGAWLALIGEFDRREGWGGYGIRSCAHWLAWQCGLSPGTAREHVRVARALQRLPGVAAALTGGTISYAKARAITRVADPDTEHALLETARASTAAQLERVVREWRRADRPPPDMASRQKFSTWWDDDGMLHVNAVLDAETGAAFLTGVESLVERGARRDRAAARRAASDDPPADRAAGAGSETGAERSVEAGGGRRVDGRLTTGWYSDLDVHDVEDGGLRAARERTTARRCAALGALASAAAEADRRAGDPPRREVVVHVDAALLADDAAAGSAYLEGGPALHPTTVARMLCEATVVTLLEAGREPLAHGRTRRAPTRAQRRALLRRDRGCTNPACTETRPERLHVHHLRGTGCSAVPPMSATWSCSATAATASPTTPTSSCIGGPDD